MSIRGKLVNDNTWLRRPELTPFKVMEHQKYKGLFFELGKDDQGRVDVRRVMYPMGWDREKVMSAIRNRERILQTEGCPHCRVENLKHKAEEMSPPEDQRLRIIPGRRPVRDWILNLWNQG